MPALDSGYFVYWVQKFEWIKEMNDNNNFWMYFLSLKKIPELAMLIFKHLVAVQVKGNRWFISVENIRISHYTILSYFSYYISDLNNCQVRFYGHGDLLFTCA